MLASVHGAAKTLAFLMVTEYFSVSYDGSLEALNHVVCRGMAIIADGHFVVHADYIDHKACPPPNAPYNRISRSHVGSRSFGCWTPVGGELLREEFAGLIENQHLVRRLHDLYGYGSLIVSGTPRGRQCSPSKKENGPPYIFPRRA